LRFERPSHSRAAGFTLLEAMLAFTMLGMVLATTYSLSVRSMRQQIDARQQYELTAMAHAVLTEYILTYPAMPTSGTYKNMWDWKITETPQGVLEPTDFDHYFEFVRVTAYVTEKASQVNPFELSTVMARRAPGI